MSRARAVIYSVVLAAVAASPARASFTITVSTFGPIGTSSVTTSPAGINCGNGASTCSASFAAGSTVTLFETPGSTMVFALWGGANGCHTNKTSCAVVMSDSKTVTAQFNPLLALSLSGNGSGVVTSTGVASISCGVTGSCASGATFKQGFYAGTVVVLRSSATSGSTFTGWTGSGCGVASTCTVTMDGYKTVIATFTSAGPFNIKVVKGGSGSGTVTSSPAGIACGGVCQSTFTAGTTITFTAVASTGSTFVGWANGGCSSSATTCVITSSSTQQGLGGSRSPSAFFYR